MNGIFKSILDSDSASSAITSIDPKEAILVILGAICLTFGLTMEPIFKWGPWMDFVSIYSNTRTKKIIFL